ncbi:MAG: DUF2783 domain-containing protein [Pseudomonadota bacterium]
MTEDDLYAALLDAHHGLSDDESHALNARLVLLLLAEAEDRPGAADLIARARALSGET